MQFKQINVCLKFEHFLETKIQQASFILYQISIVFERENCHKIVPHCVEMVPQLMFVSMPVRCWRTGGGGGWWGLDG